MDWSRALGACPGLDTGRAMLFLHLALAVAQAGSLCQPIDNGAVVVNPCVSGATALGLGAAAAGIMAATDPRDMSGVSPTTEVRWSPRASAWSDWVSPGGISHGKGLLPIGLSLGGSYALGKAYGKDSRAGAANMLVTAEAAMATFAVTELLKTTISRPRPYTSKAFEQRHPGAAEVTDDSWKSMPSGHASMAAAVTFAPATLWMLHELDRPVGERNLGPPIAAGMGAAAITAAAGHFRVRAGKHHTSDVVAGALLGAAFGVGIPVLHRALRRDAPAHTHESPGAGVDQVTVGPTGFNVTGRF